MMRRPDDVLHTVIRFLKEESGAPLIECIFVGSLIAVVFGLFLLTLKKDS